MGNYKPVIIIGAPRSGTNMLRDVLCTFEGVGTWPCDEINYIWRHGNVKVTTDEFAPSHATSQISNYIRKQFDNLANSQQLDFVIEKTCANSLRPAFVDRVIPNAHYIFIVRNGLDVISSANLRWKATLDIPYLMKKVRYVPLFDLPYYGIRYLWSRLYRFISGEKRLAFWGPQLNGMSELLGTHSLNEICAIQWLRCVEKSEFELQSLGVNRVTRVIYEDFVHNPEVELQRIVEEVGITFAGQAKIAEAVKKVSSKSVGKWQEQLSEDDLKEILPITDEVMKRYGYAAEKS